MELSQPLDAMNDFIADFKIIANNPGWYSYNNTFKYMNKKVARFESTDTYESIYIVFKKDNKVRKNALGVFNEKEEIKQLLESPENNVVTFVGVKLIDKQLLPSINRINC